jgi:hypothetical protein
MRFYESEKIVEIEAIGRKRVGGGAPFAPKPIGPFKKGILKIRRQRQRIAVV